MLLEVLRDGGERLAVMRGREAVVARASAWQGERVCAAAVAAHARPAAVHRSCAVAWRYKRRRWQRKPTAVIRRPSAAANADGARRAAVALDAAFPAALTLPRRDALVRRGAALRLELVDRAVLVAALVVALVRASFALLELAPRAISSLS